MTTTLKLLGGVSVSLATVEQYTENLPAGQQTIRAQATPGGGERKRWGLRHRHTFSTPRHFPVCALQKSGQRLFWTGDQTGQIGQARMERGDLGQTQALPPVDQMTRGLGTARQGSQRPVHLALLTGGIEEHPLQKFAQKQNVHSHAGGQRFV